MEPLGKDVQDFKHNFYNYYLCGLGSPAVLHLYKKLRRTIWAHGALGLAGENLHPKPLNSESIRAP